MLEIKSLNILVTGGTGFIGSHLIERLLSENPGKIVCTRHIREPESCFNFEKFSNKVIWAKCDVRDFSTVLGIMEEHQIDAVFHLAAKAIVDKAYQNPLEAIETNVMGTANILEACRQKGGVKSIIITSSDKAYGKAEKLPYSEEDILRGDHPYDVSKSSADLIARAYFKTYGLPIAVTRFSNTFGEGDTNFSRIIPGAIEAAIKNENLLIRSDGKMVREYTYVKDIVEGCVSLAKNINEVKGEAFNFGSNNIFSVVDAVKKIEEILNVKINYKILNIAKNEIPEQYLDWAKVKEKLGWQPKTSFANGIKESFDWYKNFYFS